MWDTTYRISGCLCSRRERVQRALTRGREYLTLSQIKKKKKKKDTFCEITQEMQWSLAIKEWQVFPKGIV